MSGLIIHYEGIILIKGKFRVKPIHITSVEIVEAQKIFGAIFHSQIPELLAERFQKASIEIFSSEDPQEKQSYFDILRRVNDLEAFELAARVFKKCPLLSSKFQMMIYLAECHPELRAQFVLNQDQPILASLIIVKVTLYALYKFAKGAIMLALVKVVYRIPLNIDKRTA